MAVSGTGVPYVAYADPSNSFKVTVKKLIAVPGSQWAQPVFRQERLILSPWPWMAAARLMSGIRCGTSPINKATVMKFDGTNWVTVGAAGFRRQIRFCIPPWL
jgi:hypothetical protein